MAKAKKKKRGRPPGSKNKKKPVKAKATKKAAKRRGRPPVKKAGTSAKPRRRRAAKSQRYTIDLKEDTERVVFAEALGNMIGVLSQIGVILEGRLSTLTSILGALASQGFEQPRAMPQSKLGQILRAQDSSRLAGATQVQAPTADQGLNAPTEASGPTQ